MGENYVVPEAFFFLVCEKKRLSGYSNTSFIYKGHVDRDMT
jgi:hypothetical protein